MKKSLPVILSILILLGCSGYIIYEYATDFVVKKTILFIQEDPALQDEIQAIIESHVSSAGGVDVNVSAPGGETDENVETVKEVTEVAEKDTGVIGKPSKQNAIEERKDRKKNITTASKSEKKERLEEHKTNTTETHSKGSDGVLSIDDLQASDKSFVMGIYYRFSASEVNNVSQMLSDGITSEEKKVIKQIVYAKVSQAEVDRLFEIAAKYQ